MTSGYTRNEPHRERPRPGGRGERVVRKGSRPGRKTLLSGDPIGWLISLHPILVAFTFIALGWGSLLLIAWRLEVIESGFLTRPVFIVGDLVLLPLCGALIAAFYRSASLDMPSEWGGRIAVASVVLAGVAAGATAAFSIFVTETYHGWWSAPHTLFIWFFGYTFISFLPRAFSDAIFYLSARKIYHVLVVVLLPVAHMTLKVTLGGSLS